MKLLLDTHVLLWAAADPRRLSQRARDMIDDRENRLFFSVASLWEVVIKSALGRADFKVDTAVLRLGLVANDFEELAISGDHVLALASLPMLHKDPFDRMLVAQAVAEDMTLLTADEQVAAYDGPILKV